MLSYLGLQTVWAAEQKKRVVEIGRKYKFKQPTAAPVTSSSSGQRARVQKLRTTPANGAASVPTAGGGGGGEDPLRDYPS